MTKINVIDSVMGAGKTSWAIQYMKENLDKKFMFITPYDDEVFRIIEACSEREFKTPMEEETGQISKRTGRRKKSKLLGLKTLLRAGDNIVSTHTLFKKFDLETLELIKAQGYVLIMDEVTDCIDRPPLDPDDVSSAEDEEDLFNEDTHTLRVEGLLEARVLMEEEGSTDKKFARVFPGENTKLGFASLRKMAAEGRLVMIKGQQGASLLMWLFPFSVFDSFTEVYCLCYLFAGQIQRAYYQLYDVPFEVCSVFKDGDRYKLGPPAPRAELEVLDRARKLLKIHKGKQNDIGIKTGANFPLSSGWYSRFRESAEKLMGKTRDWFLKDAEVNSEQALWCCPKWIKEGDKRKRGWRTGINPRSYQGCWVSTETKATNKYRHKTAIAFLSSVFFKRSISRYIEAANLKQEVDEDVYALSRMVQVLWRGCIRDGKEMKVFVPSARMRGLLRFWLDGNYTTGVNVEIEDSQGFPFVDPCEPA